MELFLNIACFVLSASLAIFWIKGLSNDPVGSNQLDRKLQLVALAMLIIILFPAISMTDDMRAMSTADIERVTRSADLLPNSDQPADVVVPPDTELFSSRHLFNMQTFARIELSIENVRPQGGSIREMANRPPPFAA
jgi:hypothetical protein